MREDVYEWFDPYAAREDAAYWEERAYYERRDLEREADMCRGAAKASEAHLRHLMDRMAEAFRYQVMSTPNPLTIKAADLGRER